MGHRWWCLRSWTRQSSPKLKAPGNVFVNAWQILLPWNGSTLAFCMESRQRILHLPRLSSNSSQTHAPQNKGIRLDVLEIFSGAGRVFFPFNGSDLFHATFMASAGKRCSQPLVDNAHGQLRVEYA